MTSAEVVKRALSQLGRGTIYKLGRGGMKPKADRPSDAAWACDCSGFAWWCLGRSRFDGELWWDTSRIHEDAAGDRAGTLFDYYAWSEARPGDVLVWGDRNGHHGHIGIVTECEESWPLRVVHCSSGNYRATGDAIAETDTGVFKANDAIVARANWVEA